MASLDPFTPALELAAALRERELSATELLDACIAAIDRLNPELNAVIWRNDERCARGRGRRPTVVWRRARQAPFLGVPLPIKDLTPVAGWPVTLRLARRPGGRQRATASWSSRRSSAPGSCCAGAPTRQSSE